MLGEIESVAPVERVFAGAADWNVVDAAPVDHVDEFRAACEGDADQGISTDTGSVTASGGERTAVGRAAGQVDSDAGGGMIVRRSCAAVAGDAVVAAHSLER